MTRLNDPSFIGFDGEPVTGRVPPRLFVYGEMSPKQRGMVAHVYKLFCDAKRVNVGGFLVQNRRLDDGTRVKMMALQGQDHVVVWPSGGPTRLSLPHGFAVVANWDRPRIFKRKTEPAVEWATDPVQVPQCKTDLEGENHVFRANSATAYFAHPMMLTEDPRSRWDYLKHGAPTLASASPVVPLCTQAGADYSTNVVHYGVDNVIKDSAGADIYTMSLSPAILIVDPESPAHAPASTTAAGTEVVLQHVRLAVTSPTFGIYTARFANERLARLDEANYSLTERNDVDVIGPIGASTPPSGTVDPELNEDLSGVFLKFGYMGTGGVGTTAGSVYYGETRVYETQFVYGQTLNIVPYASESEDAYDESGIFSESPPVAISKTIGAAAASVVDYPDIVSTVGESGFVRWRGGYKQYGVALPVAVFSEAYYGDHLQRKERIDVDYSLATEPRVKYALGWCDFLLLDGATLGVCNGRKYTNFTMASRSVAGWDGDHLANDYLFSGSAPFWVGDVIGDPGTAGRWPAWQDACEAISILPAVIAEVGAFPSTTSPTLDGEIILDEPPVNVGNYTLTSRYVIDFDHKGQFYAAIKVTVECVGAEWRQDESTYMGDLTEYAQPDYTVSIYLETNWKGTVNQTLLATATATRPAFEFQEIVKQNPYYYLLPLETDKQDMIVRLPPSFGLPVEAMTQIKNIAAHQGVNTHLVCADVRADITGPAATKAQSTAGIEFSTIENGRITPHTKYVTGQLYARTFKLSDFPDALWLLHSTKCDATEDDGGIGPGYFYMSALKTTIDTQDFRVEVRDGVHEAWSDDFMPGSSPPAFLSRDTKLYRV